ncbi:hypothetical protein U0070_025626 [Myodes glareolus]|uniref:Uncharacterized protein n=1 Tax=Myodes glareolus TaxID=447135 RepID=A0AAW0I478_MYOGA
MNQAEGSFAEICWRSTTLWILRVSVTPAHLQNQEPWMVKRVETIAKDPGLIDEAFYCVTSFWCFGEIQFIIEGWIGPGSAAVTALGVCRSAAAMVLLFLWNCSVI